MFLKRKKAGRYEYLDLVESVNIDGVNKTKTLQHFGRIDKIPKEELDRIYLKYKAPDVCIEIYRRAIEGYLQDRELRVNESPQEVDTTKVECGKSLSLHYGHLLVKQYWDRYLNLSYKINRIQTKNTDIRLFSLSQLTSYLVATKIMQPSSYLRVFDQANSFIAHPLSDVSLDSCYKTLGILSQFKHEIMQHVYKNIMKSLTLSKPKLLFFDCTNFYFEGPYDSREEFIINHQKKHILALVNEGKTDLEISNYLRSEKYLDTLDRDLKTAEKNGLFLRMHGPSKECRFAQPITGLSLVIDEQGIPLDFEVFPGNKSEYEFLPKAVQSLKEKYGITDAFYVADRGLNSAANLEYLQNNGLGFIVAQRITSLQDKYKQIMFCKDGWKTIDLSQDSWIVELCGDFDGREYRYKIADYTKQSHVELKDEKGNTSRREVKVDCKIIFTFSKKRQRCDNHSIDTMIAKANEAIASGKYAVNPSSTGWRSLLKTAAETKTNKQDKEKYRLVALDQEKIDKLRANAGYSALVFSLPYGHTPSPNDEVKAQLGYKQLVSIEECFRTMKSTLDLRPVYVKRIDHIIGHCMICILALTLIKIIQYNLKSKGIVVSTAKIQQALNNLTITAIPALGSSKVMFIDSEIMLDDLAYKRRNARKRHIDQQPDPIDLSTHLRLLADIPQLNTFELSTGIRRKLKIDSRLPVLSLKQRAHLNKVEQSLLILNKTPS